MSFSPASFHSKGGRSSPTPRHETGFVECQGKFYLIGGRGIKPVEEFDLLAGYFGADLMQKEHFLAEWYAARRVSMDAPELPEELAGKVAYRFIVTWTGPMTQGQKMRLISLIGETAAVGGVCGCGHRALALSIGRVATSVTHNGLAAPRSALAGGSPRSASR